jgi:DNA-binding XRE family transcriptional regulator
MTVAGFAPGAAGSSPSGQFVQTRCVTASTHSSSRASAFGTKAGYVFFAQIGHESYAVPVSSHVGKVDVVDLDTLLDSVITPEMSERMSVLRKQIGAAAANNEEPTLRSLRLQAGLSQQDLARRLKTNQAYISKLERGEFKDPSLSRAIDLADALGVSLDVVGKAFKQFPPSV